MSLRLVFVSVLFAMFSRNPDAATVIDPWVIAQRKAVSAALLNCTQVPALFGADNLGNVIWGLDVQTNWQINSGRQGTQSSGKVDEFAWFADINYHLTVVPYIVAMKRDLLPPAQILPPQSNSPSKFPIDYESIDPKIAQEWTDYFETIKHLQNNSTYTTLDNLLRILWVVHNTTVSLAMPKFKNELQSLNARERQFANGFGYSVEVLAILNLNTGYSSIYSLNRNFPQRVLRIWDMPPLILDMTFQQNVIVSLYFGINEMVELNLWKGFVEVLKTAMSTVNCAAKLQQAFNTFLSSPQGDLIAKLTSIALSC